MNTILSAIIPIFIIIAIGAGLQLSIPKRSRLERLLHIHKQTSWSSVLNKFALYLALPALIFSSLVKAESIHVIQANILLYLVIVLLLYMGSAFAITKLFKTPTKLANTYIFGIFFGNVAYIGFPFLSQLIQGTEGMLSIIIAIHVAIAFSFGIWILEQSEHTNQSIWIRLIKNPLLIATVIGFLVLLTSFPIPVAILTAANMLGSSASPVVLISLGMFMITEWSIDKNFIHSVAITGIKLILMPIIFIVTALFFKQSVALDLTILEAAMPGALTTFALAEKYKIDKSITANAIILSTLASLITLSLISSFVL